MSVNRALMKSEKQDWCTPPEILKIVEEVAPIAFDPAPANWDRSFDGLEVSWRRGGLTYLNPEYGRALWAWTAKAAFEFSKRGADDALIMLIPARPDTRWFQDNIVHFADALCFWRGRIKFVGAENSAPFPSAFVYFGANRERFREVFSKHGWVVML